MTGKTHLIAGIICGIGLSQVMAVDTTQQIGIVIATAIGSLAPDVDHPQSTINGIIPFFRWTHLIVGHRGALHGLWIPAILIASYWSAMPLQWLMDTIGTSYPEWLLVFLPAGGIGWLSHILLDAMTPRGVPLFFPWQKSIRLLGVFSIRTGSITENLLSIVLMMTLAGIIWIFVTPTFVGVLP